MRDAIKTVRKRRPFEPFTTVQLPDHWHLVMKLPQNDTDYPTRLKRIKEEFTTAWTAAKLPEASVTDTLRYKGQHGIWQPRYWEHTIKDERDLESFVDYIHWNPRNHRLVRRIKDWQWSSFQRFVQAGQYEIDWGGTAPECIASGMTWGEP